MWNLLFRIAGILLRLLSITLKYPLLWGNFLFVSILGKTVSLIHLKNVCLIGTLSLHSQHAFLFALATKKLRGKLVFNHYEDLIAHLSNVLNFFQFTIFFYLLVSFFKMKYSWYILVLGIQHNDLTFPLLSCYLIVFFFLFSTPQLAFGKRHDYKKKKYAHFLECYIEPKTK